MEIVRLTTEYELKPFDCGDADLNGFLLNDAKSYVEKKLACTFLLEDEGRIVAYYSLSLSAIPFYEKNGFNMLLSDDDNVHTRMMYFDMMQL